MKNVPSREKLQANGTCDGVNRAYPVAMDGIAGMYHPAKGKTAVLLISPWGFEELCSRMTYRILGEQLADLGYPCLRFDLPGTGNSAFASADVTDDDAWRKASSAAYDQLSLLSEAEDIIVVAQGVGALLAGYLAEVRRVEGLVLLAPAAQGRGYLREVAAWTAMTKAEFLVASSDGPAGGIMSAGFVMSASTVNEIKQLQPLASLSNVGRILAMTRPESAGDSRLVEEFSTKGLAADSAVFTDYADYVSSPTFALVPKATIEHILTWLAQHFPVAVSTASSDLHPSMEATITGPDYSERLVRFGPNRMFFGALTMPLKEAQSTAVVILNTAADHSIGWARSAVDLARILAPSGFPTLRIDQAGIGETPLWPDQHYPVMCDLRGNDDVDCAISWLMAEAGIERVVLLGRCSGAYPAFLSAVADKRVNGCILINVRKLHWEPDEDILKAIHDPVEPIDTYRQNLRSTRQFKRILSGELKVSTVLHKVSKTVVALAERKLAPLLGNASRHTRISRIISERLETLTTRRVPVAMIYSQGDPGLHDLFAWAGASAAKLAAHPNVDVHIVEGADHNLSPLPVRAEVTEMITRFLQDKVMPPVSSA
jgi:pimeloyl-ACP methyl ester carboxylesterase